MKIANRISLSFLALTSLLIMVVIPFQYITQKKDILNAVTTHLKAITQSRASHIKTLLEMYKRAASQLANYISLEEFLKAQRQNSDYENVPVNVVQNLERVKSANSFIQEVSLVNEKGRIVASTNKDEIGQDKSVDAYFLGAKQGPYIKDAYYHLSTKQKILAFSAPVIEKKTKSFLGVVVIKVSLEQLSDITTDKSGMGQTGEIYILNKYGYMITPSRFLKDTFLKLKVSTKNAKNCYEDCKKFGTVIHSHEAIVGLDYRGVQTLGVHYHIPEVKWCLMAEVDAVEAFAPLYRLRGVLSIVTFSVLAIVIIVGGLAARMITSPISRLYEGMNIISSGNLDYKVGTKARDEIGELSRAFDKMTAHLKETMISVDKLNKEVAIRKRVEKKLKKAMEIKSSFTSMVSHELRTPLTAIKEGIGIVLDGTAGKVNSEQQEFLDIAQRNIDRLARLINNVLDFQKLGTGKVEFNIEENDINEAVEDAVATLKPLMEDKGLKLTVNLDKSLPKMEFDRDRIAQVITNIMSNAVKFTEKGSIAVKTAKKGDNAVCVSVRDTGKGIKKVDLERAFHEFEQLETEIDRKTGGTGLGLAISKEIVERHKGKMWVESKWGKGSTFYFILPVKERRG